MSGTVKEESLSKVTGGTERPSGFEAAQYDIGYSYKSDLLWSGMPNHYITITVLDYDKVEGGIIYYKLQRKEEAYGVTPLIDTIIKPESYLINHSFDK